MKYFDAVSDAVLDKSANELIGAFVLAMFMALLISGLFALCRRRVSDPSALIGGLTIVANIACMVVAVGYVESLQKPRETPNGWVVPPTNRHHARAGFGSHVPRPASPFGFWSPGFQIVVAADSDRNGRLTPEEATQLVQKADDDGDGSVDFRDIDTFLRSRMQPPWSFVGPPAPIKRPQSNVTDQNE